MKPTFTPRVPVHTYIGNYVAARLLFDGTLDASIRDQWSLHQICHKEQPMESHKPLILLLPTTLFTEKIDPMSLLARSLAAHTAR